MVIARTRNMIVISVKDGGSRVEWLRKALGERLIQLVVVLVNKGLCKSCKYSSVSLKGGSVLQEQRCKIWHASKQSDHHCTHK